jgi:GGDEF domain-containing protein
MSEMRITEELEERGLLVPVAVLDRRPARSASAAELRRVVDHLPDTMCLIGPGGELNHVSAAVRSLLSREPWSFAGRNALRYLHPADRPRALRWFAELGASTAGEATGTLVVQLSAGDRSWVTVEVSGRRIGQEPFDVVCTLRAVDVGRATIASRPSRRRRASDGLVSRDGFARVLHALEPEAAQHPLVVFVDIDDFANVRLAYGDQAADDVVMRVRAVLSSLVRLDDVIGQIDDGSLAVLFRDVPDAEVNPLVRRIMRGMRHPVRTAGHRVRVSTSVGSVRPAVRAAATPPRLIAVT